LADRPEGYRPPGAAASANLVSLPEIIGEIRGTGRQSKSVAMEVDRLVAALGPELHILCDAGTADIRRVAGGLVAEAIARLRNGEVIKEAGYDGEYGVIRLFRPEELAGTEALFDVPAPTGSGEELFDVPAPTGSGEAPPSAPEITGAARAGEAAGAAGAAGAGAGPARDRGRGRSDIETSGRAGGWRSWIPASEKRRWPRDR